MLTPEQSRAARAWLEWSQEDLAKRASVALSTVRDFEKGRRTPIANNLEAISRVLSSEGVQLLFDAEGNASGIKINR
ncbi:helix-turn-helix transcriptional regulator [Rhodomicrobium vannielii ATCC 17100]|uniref:helix-turn-helix domain-containing protein n=1 Tax=Rhodomicrobium vannielii TaxID=1069 RepID=UPI001917C975|nr:helix-turn-helix transcriptional regulator [Rhodomicrobium vannielii]MBJ7532762.1 helix-turn-helix transcriptional regulator [Rhodomicrobium vannielii ATCC 17100]